MANNIDEKAHYGDLDWMLRPEKHAVGQDRIDGIVAAGQVDPEARAREVEDLARHIAGDSVPDASPAPASAPHPST